MKLHGSVLVIISGLMIEAINISQKRYIVFPLALFGRINGLAVQGLLFLLYPLLGHLTDVYLTRYRSLKLSCGSIIFGMCAAVVWIVIDNLASNVWNFQLFHERDTFTIIIVFLVLFMAGVGLFQANAVQFGLDQLLEAPTPKLIAFIHWYYWAQNIGDLATFYIYVSAIGFSTIETNSAIVKTLCTAILIAIVAAVVTILVKFHYANLYIQKAGLNPFKNIYKVLKYTWKHKVPERRSAFTFWEEDIPRRIDLGKNKYGGPFTNEEVEDTKTFLRILPLLLCLFGYHLAGDGYSAPEQLQRTSCPSLPVLLLIVMNPLHLSTLIAVVGIPLYRLFIEKLNLKIKSVRMLTKMWVGLYLSLLQVVIYILLVVNHDTNYWQEHHTDLYYYEVHKAKYHYSPCYQCYNVRIGYDINLTEHQPFDQYSDPVDNTYLWFIIPQLLNGLSSLLVSMTVFEFICAQAPRTTQGLLIGLWYATFSIRYLVVGILDNLIIERTPWLICEGVKGFLILMSLVLFSCVSRCYRYRQRDEIVNVQGMIEDTHERWLDQEEEYMQQCEAFYRNITTYNTLSQQTQSDVKAD